MHLKQSQIFDEHLTKEDFVNYRCDVSRARKATALSQKTVHEVRINANMSNNSVSSNHVILVLEYEPNDDTLKKHIGKGNSLIPNNLDTFRALENQSVLFNNLISRNKCGAKVDESQGSVSIDITRNNPFKVYMYSKREFKTMELHQKLKDKFDEELKIDKEKIERLKTLLVDMKRENKMLKERKVELSDSLVNVNGELEGHKESAKVMQKSTNTVCDEMCTSLKKLDAQRTAIENDNLTLNIQAIKDIFTANKINSGLADSLLTFDNFLSNISKTIASCLKTVEHFRDTQDQFMQDLLTSGWSVGDSPTKATL